MLATQVKSVRDVWQARLRASVQPGCDSPLVRPGKRERKPETHPSLSLSVWHDRPQEFIPVLSQHRSLRWRPLPSFCYLAQGPQLREVVGERQRSLFYWRHQLEGWHVSVATINLTNQHVHSLPQASSSVLETSNLHTWST